MNESENRTALPDSLVEQLKAFEKRLYFMETVVAVCGAFCGFLLTYGVLFLSDRLWDTPVLIRALLTFLGGLVFAGFAVWWFRHWRWQRRDTRELARLVQKQYSRLGDRLLGAVELASGDSPPANISPALCRAAIAQVAREAGKYDFTSAVSTRRPRRYAFAFAALFALIAIPFIVFPEAGRNALMRWARPLSSVERFTFVNIESLPANQIVPHGEEFEICCILKKRPFWRTVSAVCRFENQPEIKAIMDGKQILFRIPGQTKPGVLRLRIGDVAKNIGITPVYRPELVKLTGDVTLPDYLEKTNSRQTVAIEGGRAEFLEGSTVRFAGMVSRELKEAYLAQGATNRLEVRKERFFSGETVVSSTNCVFTWKDCYGLGATQPCALNVTVLKDEPPVVECRGIMRSAAILEDETVTLEANAEDDYGLRELTVTWSGAEGKDRSAPAIHDSRLIKNGSPDTRTLSGSFSFSPVAEHVPEETMVSLSAEACDYLPGRRPASSPVYRIYVLSRAHHAKLIQEQMEALQGKIEDLARDEEGLLNRNKKLDELAPAELAAAKTAEALKDTASSERENAGKTENLAGDGEKLIKEALRNKDVAEKTLREWAELMQTLKDAAGDMHSAAASLQEAERGTQQRADKIGKAAKLEEQVVSALKGTGMAMNKSLEDMIAQSFVNRLRAAADVEGNVATSFKDLLPDVVGIRPDNLPPDKAGTVNQLAARQDTVKKDAAYIQDDLAGFHNRTRIACYDTVHNEMIQKKMVTQLEALAALIRGNIGVKAIEEAQGWHNQFNAWADQLQKTMEGESASQANSSDADQLEKGDVEVLIALMRIRQREEALREQTRLVEEGKEKSPSHSSDARRLADKQAEIETDTASLERKSANIKVRQLAETAAGEMMNAAVYLRRPQTDQSTIAIETEIIEMLSDFISSSAGKEGQANMTAQSLMNMLGLSYGSSKTGGGSMAGGTTDKPNTGITGAPGSDNAEPHDIEKAGGIDMNDCPEEFKDALDAYFNALEEKR